jgi:hypothetical protein
LPIGPHEPLSDNHTLSAVLTCDRCVHPLSNCIIRIAAPQSVDVSAQLLEASGSAFRHDLIDSMATHLTNPDSSPETPPSQPPGGPPPKGSIAGAVDTALQRPANVGMSPRTNGIIDYIVAFTLFLAPWVLAYTDHAVAPVSRTLGAMILFYSLCTKYDLGLVRFFPLQVHLFLDAGMAVLLVAAPMHFAFWGAAGLLMAFLGLLMGASAILTRHGHKFHQPKLTVGEADEKSVGREGGSGPAPM